MLLSPIFLALGSRRDERPQRPRPVRRVGDRPDRLQPRDHRRRVFLAPTLGVDGPGDRRRRRLARPPRWSSRRRSRRRGFRYEPRIDLRRPGGAPGARAHGAAGPRAGRQPDHVHRRDRARLRRWRRASITAFNFAFTLLQIPIGVIGVPLGVVVLPSLARELARGSVEQYVGLLTRSVRLILYVMLPITGIAIVLRREVVSLLVDYGRFGDAAIDLTANTLSTSCSGWPLTR